MDKKLMGTAAVIGVVAGYMYSKDVFNSATFAASDEAECKYGEYNTVPMQKVDEMLWSKIMIDGSKGGSPDNNKRWYKVTQYTHSTTGSQGPRDVNVGQKSIQGIEAAMKWAKNYIDPTTGKVIKIKSIQDVTHDYCRSLREKTVEEEKPVDIPASDDEQEDKPPTLVEPEGNTTTTDWCAVKANSPKHIKAIPSQIKSEIAKATKKVEKEGAEELARLEARYEKAKKNCDAEEEVRKKLQDTEIGEGFWEKLLAFLNA